MGKKFHPVTLSCVFIWNWIPELFTMTISHFPGPPDRKNVDNFNFIQRIEFAERFPIWSWNEFESFLTHSAFYCIISQSDFIRMRYRTNCEILSQENFMQHLNETWCWVVQEQKFLLVLMIGDRKSKKFIVLVVHFNHPFKLIHSSSFLGSVSVFGQSLWSFGIIFLSESERSGKK